MQAIGRLLPHEGGVPAGWRLAPIEKRGTGAPHDGGRDRALLMMPDHLRELIEVLKAHDHHEGTIELWMMRCCCVTRRLLQDKIEREKRRDEAVSEGGVP